MDISFQVIAARHQEKNLGLSRDGLLPLDAKRRRSFATEDVDATREPHHLRDPMSGRVGWIEPFQAQHARTWRRFRYGPPHPGGFQTQPFCQRSPLCSAISSLRDLTDPLPEIGKTAR